MRIISTFHDYYDGVQRTLCDRSIIYNRETVKLDEVFPRSLPRFWSYSHFNQHHFPIEDHDFYIVGFCGEIYLGARVYPEPEVEKYVYGANLLPTCRELFNRYNPRHRKLLDHSIRHFLEADYSCYKTLFLKYHIPNFVIRKDLWDPGTFANPILGELGFATVKDPYTCFQEIYQYLSNELAQQNDPPQDISDEDMAAMKGFDKWSFRTPPGTKPNRKARNK